MHSRRFRSLPRAALVALLGLAPAGGAAAQIVRLPTPDSTSGNFFGAAVAIDGDRIVVGATGVDTCGPNSGAAYVYGPAGEAAWRLEAVLRPGDCAAEDFFGRAVAVDGDRIAVTAYRPYFSVYRSNAVHVFERDPDGSWSEAARIEAPGGAREGAFAAAIDLDGSRLLVTRSGGAGDDGAGGAAYVFARGEDGTWAQEARFDGAGHANEGVFGTSCVLDGDLLAVSASTYGREARGTVHVFQRTGGAEWTERAVFRGIEDFFIPMALDGGRLLVGRRDAGSGHDGAATLYGLGQDGAWRRLAQLLPPNPYPGGGFGSGVALSGDRALVVGFDEQLQFDFNIDRVVYVFGPGESGAWVERQVIDLGETFFGASVAADGTLAVIGAAADDRPGAAYVARLR